MNTQNEKQLGILFIVYWDMYKVRHLMERAEMQFYVSNPDDSDQSNSELNPDSPYGATLDTLHNRAIEWQEAVASWDDSSIMQDLKAMETISDMFAEAILTRCLAAIGNKFARYSKSVPEPEYNRSIVY